MSVLSELRIASVEELTIPVPLSILGADPALVEAHRARLGPPFISEDGTTWPLVVQSFVAWADGLRIVVDPCHGNGRHRPNWPHAHNLDTPYLERFKATGMDPEDVDLVFCTHLSCDHCGWNTQLRGGRWTPTFPNARYILVRREFEHADPAAGFPIKPHNEGVFEDSVRPVLDAGLVDLVDAPHQLRPGIRVQPAYGHTPGHAILTMDGPEGRTYFTGDAFHHPLQVAEPRLRVGRGDEDPEAAIEVRRRLAGAIADEQARMIAAHFPAPNGGRVVRRNGETLFEPF
jgi:glyoxylase-like metal-dependent hydrolase (beta-lactamase superfamily II)